MISLARIAFAVSMAGMTFALTAAPMFEEKPDFRLQTEGNVFDVGFGDVNNDGKNDIIATFYKDKSDACSVAVFYNKDGKFDSAPSLVLKDASKGLSCIAVGDFDGDGKNDIAVNDYRHISLFFGADNFMKPVGADDPNVSSREVFPVKNFWTSAGGKYCFITGATIYCWRGQSGWAHAYVYPPAKEPSNSRVIPCDMNNDGEIDLVYLSAKGVRIYYGPFMSGKILPTEVGKLETIDFAGAIFMAVGKFKGRKNPDIAICDNSGKTSIYYQSAPVGFTSKTPAVTINCSGKLFAGDFNGDGKDDLAVLDSERARLFIFLQTENGFSSDRAKADLILPVPGTWIGKVGDISGSGHPDAVLAAGKSIFVYFNRTAPAAPKTQPVPGKTEK